MLGELLNTLQHELSNPLFGLKLANDLVKMAPPVNDSEALSFLLEIDRYVDRSQKILENFRSLFKEVGDSYPTNISEIINEAITLAKSETREIKKTVELDENIVIDINPTWLTQIVFNLIINSAQALKENNNGSAQITISLIAEGNRAKIQVCDNGPGIDPSKLEQIFTPFYTTKAQGTGLGLSICQNLANKLGAHFYCDNNTTSPGVTFTLELNYT
jgi:signal transduction histidine kinase